MLEQTIPITQSNHFIILDTYIQQPKSGRSYQTENDLELELVADLTRQGYEFSSTIKTPKAMLENLRDQLQALNHMTFSDTEWQRFLETYLDKANDNIEDKSRKIHDHYVYDFVFDDGHIQNIYIVDKKNISRNRLQVIKQFEQTGAQTNRYDVTILVNGLPLVQVELKKPGVAIKEAFNQIHRYSKESFNSNASLYKYLQMFVISNGTDTRYFANTTERSKHNFDFTIQWARSDNRVIKDLKDFTALFFQKNILISVLLRYSVFDTKGKLLVMRPYQIAAAERILWKIKSAYEAKSWSSLEGGGYIWHTTGSGKTLTSFKAALLATEFDFIDKVVFVVDRKDLDIQTIKEYRRFSPESVNGSNNTAGLKLNLETVDHKITVTTIQKLNHLIKSQNDLAIYNKQVVFIFDECHRSQFGEAQKNIKKKFKQFYQFGFTGTPIFPENALNSENTTPSVFGAQLHSYVITDAIRDRKVLKFKVDYHNVRPRFKDIEKENDEKKLSAAENNQLLLHPQRIEEIAQYILKYFPYKTHRREGSERGYNAIFAVSSIDAAKLYYEKFAQLQDHAAKPLKIATIFSFAANEDQGAKGDIVDESFDVSAMNSTAKEFLSVAIANYNLLFKSNFTIDTKGFDNYYKDIAKRVKGFDENNDPIPRQDQVDLLIVVGMFLTGFDAALVNTLFVDKPLCYHGLIQAYSRTNRIYNDTKCFGNIVTFRDLEQATKDAIALFGYKDPKSMVSEKSYKDSIDSFIDVLHDLIRSFPDPSAIETESQKKEFIQLFGKYMRQENRLQNYDEFVALKALQNVDKNDAQALEDFKNEYHITDDDLAAMQTIKMLDERTIQDYRSTYNDIRDSLHREKMADENNQSSIWDDVVFEVELLKSQEINLDYILEQIFYHKHSIQDKPKLVENVRRMIRASLSNRAKEDLVVEFIDQADLIPMTDAPSLMEAFYSYAHQQQECEAQDIISAENLNADEAKRYIALSLKRGFASDHGMELHAILPKMSPISSQYQAKKQSVFEKISAFVEKFK